MVVSQGEISILARFAFIAFGHDLINIDKCYRVYVAIEFNYIV